MVDEQPPDANEQSSDSDQHPPGSEPPDSGRQPADAGEPAPGEGKDSTAGGDATERRPLQRSATDNVIAGVAGGIGAYFGIDSVIVRIAFIVLTFLGGAGPFLYLIGWLALPREESRSVIANALGGDSSHRFRSLVAVVLIGLGLLITANLSGELFETFINVWTIAPHLALVLITAGVALVLWPGPAGRSEPTPARRQAPPAPPPPAPPPSPAAGPEWSTPLPASPVTPPAAPTENAAVRRRGRTTIGYLTVAALFVYTGGTVMLDRSDAVEVDIGVFFAIALAITGVGLLISAFAVPARGLVFLGVLLCVPSLSLASADVQWGTGIGEVRVSVTDTEELADEYRHGVGQMVVDLRHLDADRTNHSVDLSLGVGELLVYVPDNLSTTADITVGAGEIRVWHSGPPPRRIQDLADVRDLLRGWSTLSYGDDVLVDVEDHLVDIEDYIDGHERLSGHPIVPEQRQALTRLLADEPGLEGASSLREAFARLVDEARGASYPWEETADGLGIGRTITVPVWGEAEGALRLDIDVGIGEAEVITVPATVP